MLAQKAILNSLQKQAFPIHSLSPFFASFFLLSFLPFSLSFFHFFFLITTCISFFFFFWPHYVHYRILVPQPEMEPRAPAVETQSPNHCATRELPSLAFSCLVSLPVCCLSPPEDCEGLEGRDSVYFAHHSISSTQHVHACVCEVTSVMSNSLQPHGQ